MELGVILLIRMKTGFYNYRFKDGRSGSVLDNSKVEHKTDRKEHGYSDKN